MKKYYSIFILFFTSGIYTNLAYTQSISKPNIPEKGVGYNIVLMNDTLSFNRTGDWDFSNQSGLQAGSTIHIAPIATNPSSDDYPYATHVKYEDDGEFMLGYEDDGFSFHGEKTILTSIYNEPLIVMPYPFKKGDKHEERKNENPFTVTNGPPGLIRDDRAITEAIASGKIIMPDGSTFENAVLVHARRTWSDRQIGSSACITDMDAYQWWVDDYAIPVAESRIMTQNGPCPPGFQNVLVTKFVTGQPLKINNQRISTTQIYPNPANNIVYLSDKTELVLVYDNKGSLVLKCSETDRIDISKIENGFYTVKLSNGMYQCTQKLFKY